MKPRQKFILKLVFCLVGAFLISEALTKFIFYPTSPAVQLSTRIWLAQKKQQISALPETFRRKLAFPRPKLPPPIIYEPPESPSSTKTPYPRQPSPPSTTTPIPTSTPPPKSPSPSPPYSPTPTPSPSKTPSPSPSPTLPPFDAGEKALALVKAINAVRANHGLQNLNAPGLLMQVGQIYTEDLNRCGHKVPGKGFIWDYAKRAGYRGTGMCEVIACGASSPERAVSMWMDDAPHRDCVLNPSGGSVGTGVWGGYWLAGIFK